MESIIYVGMDVHKDTYSLCSFDAKRSLQFSQTQMKSTAGNVVRYLKKISEMNNCIEKMRECYKFKDDETEAHKV